MLVDSFSSLQVLSSQKIPVKTSYKITKIMKKVKEEVNIFQDLKKRLIDEYGVFDDGNNFKVIPNSSEHYAKVDSELKDILNTEIEPVHLHVLEYMFV